ncbi:MAG: InlB B-repeat-containing protein [Paludibacteraceae bacterium]|nr:InlB B-repeat-containing protein [Paludibacteraceae bacterium]
MKNSTFSAQVANNLLTLLQGYSKTIRLLLVMFLTLTVTTNAWAQTKTDIMFAKGFGSYTTNSFSAAGTDKTAVANSTNATSVKYAMQVFNGSTGAVRGNQSSAASNFSCRNTTTYDGYYISQVSLTVSGGTIDGSTNNRSVVYFGSTAYSNPNNTTTPSGTATKASPTSSGQATLTWTNTNEDVSYFILYNLKTSSTALSADATNSLKVVWTKKTAAAPSFTITATSNNNSYGTVSVSGTTITATPNAGYRVKSGDAGYTVTSGTAVVTNNDNNTFSVTPSSNCTITINFEAIPKYTVTWNVNGEVYETTQVTEGSKPTFPATPSSCDATSNTFYGWATATWDGKIDNISAKTIYTSANNMPAVNGAVTYYAVFAEATTTGGGGEEKDFSFNITTADFNTTSYAANNNEKTSTAEASDGSTMEVKWTSNQVMLQSGVMQWQKNTGYIFNSTDLGTIKSVEITKTNGTFTTYYGTSEQPSSGTTVGNGYFQIKIGNATGKSSNIKVTFTQTVAGGGSTTTYDNYITTCSDSTPVETYTVTFNANGHSTAPAAQTITSGETASEPTEPKETGYTFGGWYSNQQCTGNQFDFNTPITADITLYAKWTIAEYTIKATLEHCTVAPEIPTTYTYTGSAANLAYTFTPEDGYGLPKIITFSGCEYTWNQSTGVLTLTGVIKSNVTFTIAAKKIHTITWMVDGDEHTNGEPSTTVLNNERVSTLPTNPTLDCSGKTFVGWSDQEVSDGNKPSVLFTSAGTSPQILKNTTFHAVFATLTGSGNGQNTTDILTHEINGKGNTNTSYEDFSDKSYTSDAAYAGNSANGNNKEAKGVIQLRSDKSTSGIVTTTSGGYAKSITVDWHSHTTDERTLDIYGKNTAYTAASDLYDANTRGTKLGSIVKGTSTELIIDGDYQYIGLRSYSNAIYLNSISIEWSSSASPTYTGYTTTCTFTAPALDEPAGLAVEDLTCSSVTLSWEEVENATGYEVVRTLNAHNTTYTTDEPSITIEGLTGGNENSWKVRAIGDGTNYSSSEYAVGENFTTLFSIKYYVDGVIWHGCDDGCAANGGSFDICETEPTKANNTFAGWATTADGEVEYQAGETINNIAANVTLHAVWSDVTYTVNWSVNGEDNPVTYTHGQDLALPSIDITPCDGMDHVGWTDELGYRHGTDILFTEAEGTVTSDATYYAVFATKTSSDGGAETTLNFSQKGYTNEQPISLATEGDITVTFNKGTNANNAPKYYTSGSAIRAYGGNTFTVSSENTISNIVITFGTSDGSNAITTDVGTFSTDTWSGEANSIVFTIDGSSGNRRIQSIAVTSSGSASYYTDYTTTCGSRQLETPTNLNTTDITHNSATLTWDEVAGARSYKVVINGTEYNTNTNSYTTHSLKQKTAYTWTVQAIGNGTTFIDSEISAEATFTTEVAVTITWIAGATKTTNPIIYGQSIGEALGELPTPATPDGCKGKTFMGWSTTRNIASDGSDFDPITEDIVPTENTTYYAVFAQGDIAGAANITDELTHTINGKESSGNTYMAFTDKKYTSDALYAGSSANGYSAIQLRSTNNSGIVTTTSGGSIKSITVVWDSNTLADRTLDIYGKNTAYSAASDLYDDTKKGSLLGSIANGTSTPLTIDGNYQYIGLRSKSGAMYLTSITIVWQSGEVTYTDYSTSCGDFLVTYYGFTGGYSTTCDENPGERLVPQFSTYTIPDCTPTTDPQELGRTFAGTWIDDSGKSYKPGDSFEVTKNTTLYAQWTWNTNTIPTDESGIADLATTDVVVTGGNTLTLAEGTTTINSLTLKGGLQADSTYAMPVVNIPEGATLVRNNNKINLDLVVNSKSWYPFAVPFAATIDANVEYLDSTLAAASRYGTHFAIKTYDGARRAEEGVDQTNNWVQLNRNEKLQPGVGYIISALTYPDKDTATIRIPMSVSNDWLANGEQFQIDTITRNAVEVVAHKGAAATEHQRHAGWNFVANPYLTNFAGENASNDGSFINGEIRINNGEYSYDGEDVPYVTIPTYNFAHYNQVKLSDATLSPAYSFFVQVGKGGTMSFAAEGRQTAPASIAARNAEERPVKMDVDITLSDNHSSDQTGIIISDRYSDAYEIGRDLEKLFGSAYNLSVYTLMADNTPLAFQALAIRSNMQVIPVGYRAPEQGEYTFRLNEATSSIDLLNEQYEQLVLVDYQTGELTNLLISDYTFYSERTQADNRFAIYAVPRQNAPTDLPNAIGQDKQAQKIIHNGHLYILRDGNVYNGNGQIVK